MSKVQNVALPAKRRNCLQGHSADFFLGPKQHRRVDIPLQCDARAPRIPQFPQIHAPIHAEYIGTFPPSPETISCVAGKAKSS